MSTRSKLTITRELLADAAAGANVDPADVPAMWERLDAAAPEHAFNVPNVAFYFGAMTVISALTWFMTNAWNGTGGLFKLGAALIYAATFTGAGLWLRDRGMRVPSGLLFTAAVCMTPLAVYGIESATGFWVDGNPGGYTDFYPWIRGSWIFMELATIAVGLIAVRLVRFPFLVAPIGFAAWFLSMDLAAFACDRNGSADFHLRATVSIVVGLVTIAAALLVDRVTRQDYAFWLYLFGSASFWGGLWARSSDSGQFAALVIGLLFIAASLVLGRRVLAVFGSLGCFGYMGHLAWAFRDSLAFPVALTLVGLAIIAFGISLQRYLPALERSVGAMMPVAVRKWLPRSRLG